MLIQQDKPKDAAAIFKKNASTFPNISDIHAGLGEALLRAGDLKSAKQAFEKALVLEPSNPRVLEILKHF